VRVPLPCVAGSAEATRKQDSYLRARFLRLKGRRGPKKAIIAVAASMLTAAYVMLRDGVESRDLGPTYLATRDEAATAQRLLRRLQHLGVVVEVVEVKEMAA
jgi:transposase